MALPHFRGLLKPPSGGNDVLTRYDRLQSLLDCCDSLNDFDLQLVAPCRHASIRRLLGCNDEGLGLLPRHVVTLMLKKRRHHNTAIQLLILPTQQR
jgi:hypothetical protein